MQDLKLTLFQTDLFWEDSEKNIQHFDQLISVSDPDSDLIILPEMFNTGFSINPEKCAEEADGLASGWMKEKAVELNKAITGSILVKEGGKYFNRLFFCYPDGSIKTYDKKHLFRMSEEYKVFDAGRERLVLEYKGWKILPLICYDLRFPAWARNTFRKGFYEYDFMFYVANWPATRSHVWRTLLMARAIENQVFCAGVNRIGKDGHGTDHSGDSMLVGPKGNIISLFEPSKEEVKKLKISYDELQAFRKKFTVGYDWDRFKLL